MVLLEFLPGESPGRKVLLHHNVIQSNKLPFGQQLLCFHVSVTTVPSILKISVLLSFQIFA